MGKHSRHNSSQKVLGIDIGGTGIKAAIVNTVNGQILSDVKKIPTPQPSLPDLLLDSIECIVQNFQWNGPVGVGFPAVIKNGVTRSAANVDRKWINFNALSAFKQRLNNPIYLVNDADAAGLAEMKFGAGRQYYGHNGGTVLLFTLGTGIGSALFVDGHLVPNTELGHIEIDGHDAEKFAAASVKTRLNLSWEEWSKQLNEFLLRIEFLLAPDAIIIGGGISEDCQQFFHLINVQATLLSALMGNDAGIIGAAMISELH